MGHSVCVLPVALVWPSCGPRVALVWPSCGHYVALHKMFMLAVAGCPRVFLMPCDTAATAEQYIVGARRANTLWPHTKQQAQAITCSTIQP